MKTQLIAAIMAMFNTPKGGGVDFAHDSKHQTWRKRRNVGNAEQKRRAAIRRMSRRKR